MKEIGVDTGETPVPRVEVGEGGAGEMPMPRDGVVLRLGFEEVGCIESFGAIGVVDGELVA